MVDIETSIRAHEEALAGLAKDADSVQTARLLAGLASLLTQRRRFSQEVNVERAIECLERALSILSPEREPMDWAMAQNDLADAYGQRVKGARPDNLRRALEANHGSLAMFARLGAREAWAQAQITRALLLEECSHPSREACLRDAEAACLRALSVYTLELHPEAHSAVARTLYRLRSRHQGESRDAALDEAIAQGERRLAALANRPSSEQAQELVHLGIAYAERTNGNVSQDRERSIELLERAVTLADQRTDPLGWGSAVHNLAQTWQTRSEGLRADNLERSLALCEAALVVISNNDHPREHSEILETLGYGFVERVRGGKQDNLTKAVEIYSTALHHRRRGDNPEAWLRLEQKCRQAERQLAWRLRNEPQDAGDAPKHEDPRPPRDQDEYLAELQGFVALASPDQHPGTWIAAQLQLGDAYTQLLPRDANAGLDAMADTVRTNCPKAIAIYEAALPVAKRTGNHEQWALLHDRIGVAFGMMHLFAGVQAQAGADDASRRSFEEEARQCYEKSVAAHTAALKVHSLERAPRAHLRGAMHLGRLTMLEREWDAAERHFAAAARAADRLLAAVELSESETKDILEALADLAAAAPYAALMLDKPASAIALAESGRARLLAKALTLQALPLAADVRDSLHTLQRDVARHERKLVSPWLFDRRTPLNASIELRNRIRALAESVESSAGLAGADAASALAEVTANGAVVVMPVIASKGGRIMIAHARGGTLQLHVAECEGDEPLSEMSRRFAEARPDLWNRPDARRVAPPIFETMARGLGGAFATPLAHALDRLGIPQGTHLDILPQGPLGVLPLSVASANGGGQQLLDRYEISYSPSLASLRRGRSRAAERAASILTVGNPDGDLKWADVEAPLAARWFPPEQARRFGPDAIDPSRLLAALPEAAVWHFATHAFFDPAAPPRSWLSLGPKIALTLEQLLETSGLGAPRLVLLSACSSGLYGTDRFPHELIGLPTGFLHAGAAGVIGTLWPVEDLATALLVARFFEELAGRGLAPAAALRAAQIWLRGVSKAEAKATLMHARPGDKALSAAVDGVLKGHSDEGPFASPTFWAGFVHYGV